MIRPDPRGFGQSERTVHGPSISDFAADVAAVLDREKTVAVAVVGHGAATRAHATAARPDLGCGVVMAEASAGELAPGFTEKPYSRLRDAINGAGDLSPPVTKRKDCLQRA